MMQVFNLLFDKRLYPVWIAGQIWFGMANAGMSAIQDGSHNWGNKTSHVISHYLIPLELTDPLTPIPKQPDTYTTAMSGKPISIQPAVMADTGIDHEHIYKDHFYLLYLLKQPPPSFYPAA